MKLTGLLFACVLAGSAVPAIAQERAKSVHGPGMEMVELLAQYAKSSGKQFAIDPRVRGDVPMAGIDPARLTHAQLLAILDLHQLAVIDAGGILAVVPDADGRQLPTPIYPDAAFQALDHELVTLLAQPKNLCAAFLVPVLRPLMPQAAHLAAEIQTNVLIINDRAANARRIAALVDQLDQRGGGKKDCPSPGGFQTFTPAPAPAKSAG